MKSFKKSAKRGIKTFLCILLIIVCTLSVIQKAFIVPIHNVFDEMYYSALSSIIDNNFIPWGRWITGCEYGTVGVYAPNGGTLDMTDKSDAERGIFYRRYRENHLEKREQITIYVYFEKKILHYTFTINEEKEDAPSEGKYSEDYPRSIIWSYDYYVDKKTMYRNGPVLNYTEGEEEIQTTDEEQIASFLQENGYDKTAEEYEHYFLYDKIIHDWTLGNLFRSKYATWWIGSVKFVDGPPPQEAA